MIRHYFLAYLSIVVIFTLLLPACDKGKDSIAVATDIQKSPPAVEMESISSIEIPDSETGNERFIFDVDDHSIEELQSLLNRADEINVSQRDNYEDLDIVLILHGSDINLFTYQNYKQNKALVDLAARLDAFGIIDIKICETAMAQLGISRDELPPFIEPVPYAPQAMKELTERGYINL